MISRNLSSERVSPPLASGWWRFTSSLKRALISSLRGRARPDRAPRALFFSSGFSCAAALGRLLARGLGPPCEKRVRVERAACRIPAAAAGSSAGRGAVRPGVGADLPGRPVAGQRVLLEVLDLGVAHAVEVVVGGIVLAHVIDAEAGSTRRRGRDPSARGGRRAPCSPSTGSGHALLARGLAGLALASRRGCCRSIWS